MTDFSLEVRGVQHEASLEVRGVHLGGCTQGGGTRVVYRGALWYPAEVDLGLRINNKILGVRAPSRAGPLN